MIGYILLAAGVTGMAGSLLYAFISAAKFKKENAEISRRLDIIYKTGDTK